MLRLDDPELLSTSQSRYRQAFVRGYRALRFEPALECEFEQFHNRQNLTRIRLAAFLALVLFAAFVAIDLLTLPAAVSHRTALIRACIVIPAFVVVLIVTMRAQWSRALQTVLLWVSMVAGIGTTAVIGVGLWQRAPLPYEGILLVALFIYLIACLMWRKALVANGVTLAAFIGMELALQTDPQARFYQITFMCAANAVGAYGGYFLEHGLRTTFLVNALLNELAERDGLTGLYNRRMLNSHLDRAGRHATRERSHLALAMIDVDFFKAYNDRYGHAAGDAALKLVADAIATQARRPMDLAARYGGEEFAIVWDHPVPTHLAAMGERIRSAVAALAIPHADSPTGVLSISIGIATLHPTDANADADLIRAADRALYAAKNGGRDRVVVDAQA